MEGRVLKVLFVCTGNLCRSPMAAGLLRHALEERGCTGIEVASAGTWAGNGGRAMPEAVAVLRERGVEIGSHRSRPLDPKEVEEADLVVAMTSVHVRELLDEVPEVAPKVVLLKALAEIAEGPVGGTSAAERLQALLDAPRPEWHRALDVDDPIGLPLSAYEKCVMEIQAGVDALVDLLCEKHKGETDPAR